MYNQMYFNPNNVNVEKVEIGYKLLMRLAYKIFGEYSFLFFLLCAILTIIPVYVLIKKKAKYPSESLFYFVTLGFYVLSFNMVRQSIAMSLCFWALQFLFDKKFFKYMAIVVIACLFHITAIIMIPIYWISRTRLDTRKLIILMILLVLGGILFNPFFNYIASIIPQYNMYVNYNGEDAGIGTYLINIIYLVLIFLCIISRKSITENDKNNSILINIITLSTFFIVASFRGALFARLIYYWLMPITLLIPYLTRIVKKIQRTSLQSLITIAFIAFYLIYIYSFNGVYPYNSIWNI